MDTIIEDLIRQVNRLQIQVDGLIKPEVGRWVSWTPAVTQGVGITLSGVSGRYLTLGNLCVFHGGANLTSAGTAANIIRLSGLPLTPLSVLVGGARFLDTGTTIYTPLMYWYSPASAFEFLCDQSASVLGIAPAYTIANGDFFSFFGMIEF